MINSVVIVGRVGQDPDVKYFDSGKVKTVLSVAANRWAKDGEKTDWFRIELWDKKAEVAGEYAKKGALIAIEGRLAQNKWTTPSGENREYYYVRANDIRLLGRKEAQ
ncbi:MAG: single-stranded DNA-binding protein [Candidatus Gastranaerophilales bacterium]|nr:single-stranded DNA-binding protein [Candidatus Gastranaerophilales bacterium]